MTDDEIPHHPALDDMPDWARKHEQAIDRLQRLVQQLTRIVTEQRDQLEDVARRFTDERPERHRRMDEPAPWAVFEVPATTDEAGNELSVVPALERFVQFYNSTYVGLSGSRAVVIPDCWLNHPALVAEIATLAQTWRDAHVGPHASARDAQYWHHQWRPGFAARLVSEWTHAQCREEAHKQAGADGRAARFTGR